MRSKLAALWFRLRGIDPNAVVVSFLSGEPALAQAMLAEVQRLIPERRHFAAALAPAPPEIDGVPVIALRTASAGDLWLQLRPALRGLRIGIAPVLFTPDRKFAGLRIAALLLAPSRILAYNPRLDRHHLQLSSPLASFLFWRGVPLDRIWLRPRGWPGRREFSTAPDTIDVLEGRPLSPARARAAILTPYFPYPLSHGGAVRIFHLLREAAHTHDLFLFAFTEREAPEDFVPLLDFCAKLILVPKPRYREPRWASLDPPEAGEYRSPAMSRALARTLREFDIPVLQVEYTQLAPYLGQILVEHDITFDLYSQVHQSRRTLSSWWDLFRWRRFEHAAIRRASRVVVMSAKDAHLSQRPDALVIPNGVDLARFRPVPETPGYRLLFIGSFRHFPNIVAFRFLAEQVWPRVISLFPNAELTVVAGPDPLLYWPGHTLPDLPRVRLLEFVADVRPLYEQTNVVLVPTLVSAGTNVKVLEAMAMARAVVSSTSGCAGLGLTRGESVWIADGADSFVHGISVLLADTTLRTRLAAEARRLAEQRFSWTRLGAVQRQIFGEFTPLPVRIRPAAPDDLGAIQAIQHTSPDAAQWPSADYLRYCCTVAVYHEDIAGFLLLRETAPSESEILNLAVAPQFRRLGIAAQLLAHALARISGDIFLEVRESNAAARALYHSFGFTEAGLRPGYYTEPPEAAIVMRLRSC